VQKIKTRRASNASRERRILLTSKRGRSRVENSSFAREASRTD